MKIELKSIRHNERLSRGTFCFSATVWIDGKRAGEVTNSGDGGCSRYEPHTLEDRLDAHAATLPRVVRKDFEYQPTGDQLIFDLVADWLIEKDLKGLLKNRIIYVKDGVIRPTKTIPQSDLNQLLGPGLGRVREKLGTDTILNVMPFAEALALYASHQADA